MHSWLILLCSGYYEVISDQYTSDYCAERKELLVSYEELFKNFSKTVNTSSENFFHALFSASNSVFALERDMFRNCDCRELLQYISEQRTCFSDIFLEMKIIRCVGSEKDIEACDFFERRFDKSVQGLALEHVCPPVDEGTFHVEFILDRDQREYDFSKFEHELGKHFSIPLESMKVKFSEFGGQVILLQIPKDCSSVFVFAPLHGSKILALKNQCVQFARYKEHKMFLSKWNIYYDQDITLGETLYCNGCNKIISVSLRGSKYMALCYSLQSDDSTEESDEDYIQYLESVFNNNYKNIPAMKGLYYPEDDSKQYPLLIMEHLSDFRSVKFPVEEIIQVSFLLDLVNCINEFMATSKDIKIKIHADAVYLCESENKLEAKLCPIYGYTFLFDHLMEKPSHEKQSKSLSVENLRWMSDITRYLQFGNDHDELPETHVLKKLLNQWWLSEEDQVRPLNYEVLCKELRDLHGNDFCSFRVNACKGL